MRNTITCLAFLAFLLAACSAQPGGLSPEAQQGRRIFRANCASCHAVEGRAVIVGPSLAGIGSTAAGRVPGQEAYEYIKTSIVDPGAYVVEGYKNNMPIRYAYTLDTDEMEALIAYLFTLE